MVVEVANDDLAEIGESEDVARYIYVLETSMLVWIKTQI